MEPIDPASSAVSGAASILEKCLGLTQGASFLLLVDETALSVVNPFFAAASQLGINLTTLFYSCEQQLRVDDLGRLAKDALESAEAALLAHTADDAWSRFRTKLVSQWRGHTRLATMPGAEVRILEIASRSDYDQMRKRCEMLTPPLLNGRDCSVTTFAPDGRPFVLRFKLSGQERSPVHSIGILREHAWGNVPSGEIFTAPLETSADGDYLVDGAIGRLVLDRDPAILTFEGGRLVRHSFLNSGEPIPYLSELERLSQERRDPNWNVIAEFGIGVNEGIDQPLGIPLIDEKVYGTIHIGLGNNVGWQGINRSLLHVDMITRRPDVEIDGRPVLRRGRHDFDPATFDDLASYKPFPTHSWPEHATVARFNASSFALQRNGRFMVQLRATQSGRITEFPLANTQTSTAARRLAKLAHDEILDLRCLPLDASIPIGKELRRLLSMLWSYGVIDPIGLE